jgi:hypothetical protein
MHICIKTGCGRRGLKDERAISKYHEPDAKRRGDGKSKVRWFDEGSVLTGLGEGADAGRPSGRILPLFAAFWCLQVTLQSASYWWTIVVIY